MPRIIILARLARRAVSMTPHSDGTVGGAQALFSSGRGGLHSALVRFPPKLDSRRVLPGLLLEQRGDALADGLRCGGFLCRAPPAIFHHFKHTRTHAHAHTCTTHARTHTRKGM